MMAMADYYRDGNDSTYYDGPTTTKTPAEWVQQYLNIPQQSTMPLADKLALYYHLKCEHIDRMICRERDQHGDALPVMSWEVDGVQHTSRLVIDEILRTYPTVQRGDLWSSIKRLGHSHLTTTAIEEMWWRECGSLPRLEADHDRDPRLVLQSAPATVVFTAQQMSDLIETTNELGTDEDCK